MSATNSYQDLLLGQLPQNVADGLVALDVNGNLTYPGSGTVLAAPGALNDPTGIPITDGSNIFFPGGNGYALASSSAVFYPGGEEMADADNLYDPIGHTVTDGDTIFFPGGNGFSLATEELLYYPNSTTLTDSSVVYDPFGNVVLDGTVIYVPGGVGQPFVSASTIFHPGGPTFADSTNVYDPTGGLITDSTNLYYPGGAANVLGGGFALFAPGNNILHDGFNIFYPNINTSMANGSGLLYPNNMGSLADTTLHLLSYPTSSEPTYIQAGMYFNTTLNKMRIGGGTAWQSLTPLDVGTGWTANASGGDKTVAVQNFAASGFNGTMTTALNTVSAGSGTFFAAQAQQVQDLTNKLQAIEAALVALLLPNA